MSEEVKESKLTAAQRARIERNRAKALSLRQAKLVSHPYQSQQKPEKSANGELLLSQPKVNESIIKVQNTKYIDSGGGFLLEQNIVAGMPSKKDTASAVINEALEIPIAYEECLDCGDAFVDSFLFTNFGYSVCDKCHDSKERHSLITRTEAKAEYLLKDCDFDRREPKLRYISRKNPHNVRWGEMKLYLHLQVEKRALDVWGSEEELVRQHQMREETREVSKVRKYNKNLKQLRMEVRSSLYKKDTKATHVHEFGPDTYNADEDNYTHACQTCAYEETYEKM